MKRFLAFIMIVLIVCSALTFADETDYFESFVYTELSEKSGGNDVIGGFIDYKTLVNRHLSDLLSMNSAERQRLIKKILADAGRVCVNEAEVDFTETEFSDYLAYASANVAETKSYLKYNGISSIAEAPLTVDFGASESVSLTFFKSYLSAAYNSGISSVFIKTDYAGVMLDIPELASVTDGAEISISLIACKKYDLSDNYKNAAKSDMLYRFIISDGAEINDKLANCHMFLYGVSDEKMVYSVCEYNGEISAAYVSARYDGSKVSFAVKDLRWFGVYGDEETPLQSFPDVSYTYWAYEYVEYLAQKGIISGSGGVFNPESMITREEFVKMLAEAASLLSDNAQCDFADVKPQEWYYSYVSSVCGCGIASGMDENYFGIGANITRQDIAVMAARTLEYKGIILNVESAPMFSDAELISDYAIEASALMQYIGVISGDENNNFNPLDSATRAEAAKIVYMLTNCIESYDII